MLGAKRKPINSKKTKQIIPLSNNQLNEDIQSNEMEMDMISLNSPLLLSPKKKNQQHQQPQQQQQPTITTPSSLSLLLPLHQQITQNKLSDEEKFSTDDNLTRRLIYQTVNENPNNIATIFAFNITKSHFIEEGASSFMHLNEKGASFFYKMIHLISYCIGNKTPAIFENQTPVKMKKVVEVIENEDVNISHANNTSGMIDIEFELNYNNIF